MLYDSILYDNYEIWDFVEEAGKLINLNQFHFGHQAFCDYCKCLSSERSSNNLIFQLLNNVFLINNATTHTQVCELYALYNSVKCGSHCLRVSCRRIVLWYIMKIPSLDPGNLENVRLYIRIICCKMNSFQHMRKPLHLNSQGASQPWRQTLKIQPCKVRYNRMIFSCIF